MATDRIGHDDMVSRMVVGRIARELIDEYADDGRIQKALGVFKLCERMGVVVPDTLKDDGTGSHGH